MGLAVIFGGFGLIIGSFLNVLILRHDVRPVTGRSACASCARKLSWYELVPVFSWMIQRGRCRSCGAWISVQYPIVELSTAAVFALISLAFLSQGLPGSMFFSFTLLAGYFAIAALLIAITVYDIQHMLIPDEWVYLFGALALLTSLLSPPWGMSAVSILLSGPIAAAPLYALWAVSRGTWMGLGDPKLALGMGWLLGWYFGLTAVFVAFILGALISVCILIPLSSLRKASGQITMKSEVPFGPFLIASTFLMWILAMYGVEWSLFTW